MRLSEDSASSRPDFDIKFRRGDRESVGTSGHDSCVAALNFSLLGVSVGFSADKVCC